MCQNTVAIWMAAILQCLLITLKGIELEKVSLIDTQNSKAALSHIESRWEASYA